MPAHLKFGGFKSHDSQAPTCFGLGGKFTCTWGSTKTAFDEAVQKIFLGHWLGPSDAPKSASPHIERFGGTLRDAADASECAADTAPEYKFLAMTYAAQV